MQAPTTTRSPVYDGKDVVDLKEKVDIEKQDTGIPSLDRVPSSDVAEVYIDPELEKKVM